MPVAIGTPTKRSISAAELIPQESVASKKPRGGDPPLERHQATLLPEAVDVNSTTLQPEPPATSQVQMAQTAAKPIKGRRRFMADLEELKSAGFSLHNHRVNSTWKWLSLHTHRPTNLFRVTPWRRRRIRRVFYLEGESTSCHRQSPRFR